ncbi:MAG: hypothetical protein KIG83_01445 [Treponema sp.]|nr:hypothetical protein [Treponema sp.]
MPPSVIPNLFQWFLSEKPGSNANLKVWGVSTKHPGVEKELCSASKAAAAKSQAASAEYFKGWLTNRFTAVDNIIKNLK